MLIKTIELEFTIGPIKLRKVSRFVSWSAFKETVKGNTMAGFAMVKVYLFRVLVL